jgi:hypothetical protein
METKKLTTYYVNVERQEASEDDLTVRHILEQAGFKPADQYRLIRDQPHHEYTDLDHVVEVHNEERFTAVFNGPTPTS